MSNRPVPGQTCLACRAALVSTSSNCPSCGKLDLASYRREAMRAVMPSAAFAATIFVVLAAVTAVTVGPTWIAGLGGAIDDQFKPAPVKKK
jgi:hypothetical protein